MPRVFRDERQPSTAEKFGQAFSGLGQSLGESIPQYLQQQQREMSQNEFLKRIAPEMDFSGASPEMKEKYFESILKRHGEEEKFGRERDIAGLKEKSTKEESILPYKSGLQSIQRMREIGKEGRLGRGSSIRGFFGGETAKNRGEYEQLGKSLIQLSTNIPIRNQREFEALAHNLYDPSLPDDQREGILNAMESILNRSIGEEGMPSQGEEIKPVSGMTVRNKKTGQQMQFDGSSWKPI